MGLTPEGVAALIKAGIRVSVEDGLRCAPLPIDGYAAAGARRSWPRIAGPRRPHDAIIFGLKELPEDGTPLTHRHIMFGHAFKGQPAGQVLLQRFKAGGGTLYDLEYLVDEDGPPRRRLWLLGGLCRGGRGAEMLGGATARRALRAGRARCPRSAALAGATWRRAGTASRPPPRTDHRRAWPRRHRVPPIFALRWALQVTSWDMAETASGGPFPEVLQHEIFLNCILARPGCPVFVPASAKTDPARKLTVIGDIACDPTSDFSPIKVYDRATDWDAPALRVATTRRRWT